MKKNELIHVLYFFVWATSEFKTYPFNSFGTKYILEIGLTEICSEAFEILGLPLAGSALLSGGGGGGRRGGGGAVKEGLGLEGAGRGGGLWG
jgi:hypothetical protein